MATWQRLAAVLVAVVVAGNTLVAGAAFAAGTGTISGVVFQDLNRNGLQDPGEAGFANQAMYLYNGTGGIVAAVYTDAKGTYSFGGLADGSYSVGFVPSFWAALQHDWVPVTIPAPAPGYLNPKIVVTLAGSAVANLALRPVVRSTTPLSTITTPSGTVINSFDDVVPASVVGTALASNSLLGAEQPLTTIDFDEPSSYTAVTVSGAPGSYFNFSATVDIAYGNWVPQFDLPVSYEYGHAWSEYYADIVQQDPTLTAYLAARGLTGNPNLGTVLSWTPLELIADDYRQLFGSPNAQAFPPLNDQIPLAAQVPGLKTFLEGAFMTARNQPAPSVTGVTPGRGPATGGTSVSVTGANFQGAGWTTTGVFFGGVAAQSFVPVSPTQVNAVAPSGTGTADVTVRTTSAGGVPQVTAVTPVDQFTWAASPPAPVIASLSPAKGPIRGGTSVTITGTGFSGAGFTAVSVSFGGSPASFTVTSPTTIVAVSPAVKTAQSVSVAVTTPGGTGSATFSYTRK